MNKRVLAYLNQEETLLFLEKLEGLKNNPDKFYKEFKKALELACRYLCFPQIEIDNLFKSKDMMLKRHVFWKWLYEQNLHFKLRDYDFDSKLLIPKRRKIQEFKFVSVAALSSENLPGYEFNTSKSAYIFFRGKPYLLTLKGGYFDDDFQSEQKWTYKPAAILMGASIISLESGWFSYDLKDSYEIPLQENGFSFQQFNAKSIEKIKSKMELYDFVHSKTGITEEHVKQEYEFRYDMDIGKFNETIKAIDDTNEPLIRCFYYFAKACVLIRHRMFMEEATALQFFCLDGLTKLLLKKHNITIKKLDSFLMNRYKCPYGDWLKDCHDKRTIYVHPENDIEKSWCPAWDADTCYETIDLTKDLFEIYLFDRWVPRFDFANTALTRGGK